MAHDILKLALTLIILALLVAIMALFVFNYLSAFKAGDLKGQAPSIYGRSAHVVKPSPSPTAIEATPPGMPEATEPEVAQPSPAGLEAPPGVDVIPVVTAPQVPSLEVPGLDSVIELLFRWLSLIFSHHFDLSPVWPRFTFPAC